jgi:hypothetical protein
MKILPQYSGLRTDCDGAGAETDLAVVGLEASLRSSESLHAILECAKKRCTTRPFASDKLRTIEELCRIYEAHHKAVRDHCLDYFNAVPNDRIQPQVRARTGELVRKGQELCAQLRAVLLATY